MKYLPLFFLLLFASIGHAEDWNTDLDGQDFNTATNWNPQVVPALIARFGNITTAPRNVILSSSISLPSIEFDHTESYTLSSSSGAAFQDISSITSTNGAHIISADLQTATTLALAQNSSENLTILSIISADTLVKTGDGTVILGNNNNAFSNLQLQGGSLSISNRAQLSSANIEVTAPSTLIADISSGVGTFQGPMSLVSDLTITSVTRRLAIEIREPVEGAGSLIVGSDANGLHNVIFSSPNTHTGGTVLQGNRLNVSVRDPSAFGTGPLTLNILELDSSRIRVDNGPSFTLENDIILQQNASFTTSISTPILTFNGTISGPGAMYFYEPGAADVTYALNAENTYEGGTIVGIPVIFDVGSNNAFGTGDIQRNVPVFFYTGVTFNAIGGARSIDNNIDLGDENDNSPVDYYNPFGGGSLTLSALDGDLIFNGNVIFSGENRNPAFDPPNLFITGTNRVIFNGTNDFTDTNIVVEPGASVIFTQDVSEQGVSNIAFQGNNTLSSTTESVVISTPVEITTQLTVEAAEGTTLTLASPVTGTGDIRKEGTGTLQLEDSNFTGNIFIEEGTFFVPANLSLPNNPVSLAPLAILYSNGTLADTTNNGGSIIGNGTYGNLIIASGSISPGESIGIVNVSGDYTQNSGAIYEVEIDGTESDQILVTGNAIIQEGAILTVLPPTGTILQGSTYDILQAANINQLWSVTNFPSDFAFSLELVEGNTIARLTLENSMSFVGLPVAGGAPNTLATYINTIEITDNADLQSVIEAIEQNPETINDSLDCLHPALFASFELTNIENNAWVAAKVEQQIESLTCAVGEIFREKSSSFWVAPITSFGDRDPLQELPGYKTDSAGGILGWNTSFGQEWLFGSAAGYHQTHVRWKEGKGKATIRKAIGSLYSSYKLGRFQNIFSVLGGVNFYDADRNISYSGITRTATNTHIGGFITARSRGKLRLHGEKYPIYLLGNIDYHYLGQEKYEETGANSLNLVVNSQSSHFLQGKLGISAEKFWEKNTRCYGFFFRGSWVHKAPLRDGKLTSKFASFQNSNASLTVFSFDENTNYFSPEIGLQMSSAEDFALSLHYQGELRKGSSLHALAAGVSFLF